MKHFLRVFICSSIFLLTMAACTPRHATSHRFTRIDSLAFNLPDSALVLLQAYDDAPEGTRFGSQGPDSVLQAVFGRKPLDKAGRIHLELMRGVAMNKAWVDFTTDSVMLEVADYYRRHGSRNEQLLSLYILGCAYRDLGNAPRAIDTWLQAAAAADTTAADCDWGTLLRVHSQLQELYCRLRLPDLELPALQSALRESLYIGDTASFLIFKMKLCARLFDKGSYEECIKQGEDIRKKYSSERNYVNLISILCMQSHLALGNYSLAKKELENYEKAVLQTGYGIVTGGKGGWLAVKGEFYLKTGRPDSALFCFRQALSDRPLWSNELMIYNGLYQSYAMLNETDSAVKYVDLYSEAKNQEYSDAAAQATIQAGQLYDYNSEQQIAARKSEENARLKVWLISTLLLTLVSTLLFLLYRERKKRRIAELLREYEQAVRENDSMRITITQMSQKIQSGDQYMVDLFQRYEDQNKRIESLNRRLSVLLPRRKNVILDDTGIVHRINIYLYKHDQTMSEQDWEELRHAVNESYPFLDEKLETLVHLSLNEYRVCLLDLAGFSSKESDILLEQAFSYTSKTKQRILKKMFGKQLSAAEFSKRIRRL